MAPQIEVVNLCGIDLLKKMPVKLVKDKNKSMSNNRWT